MRITSAKQHATINRTCARLFNKSAKKEKKITAKEKKKKSFFSFCFLLRRFCCRSIVPMQLHYHSMYLCLCLDPVRSDISTTPFEQTQKKKKKKKTCERVLSICRQFDSLSVVLATHLPSLSINNRRATDFDPNSFFFCARKTNFSLFEPNFEPKSQNQV